MAKMSDYRVRHDADSRRYMIEFDSCDDGWIPVEGYLNRWEKKSDAYATLAIYQSREREDWRNDFYKAPSVRLAVTAWVNGDMSDVELTNELKRLKEDLT